MPAPRKYPQELWDRAIRLVQEARQEEPELSVTAAVTRISAKIGVNPDTLRGWVKQVESGVLGPARGRVRQARFPSTVGRSTLHHTGAPIFG